MRSRQIGSTGVAVTELGLGGAVLGNLGGPVSERDADALVETALEAGIRYVDTAPHYGLGLSERRLGRALRRVGAADVVVSTKVGRALDRNPNPQGSDLAEGGFDVPDDLVRRFDFSARGVRESLEQSLERLGMDRVDVVYLHDPDDHAEEALAEALPALVELRNQGVIGAVGVGITQWQVPLWMVAEATDLDVVMLAGRWTLLDRSGLPLLDACLKQGVSVVAAAPFNSGLLAQTRPSLEHWHDYRPVDETALRLAQSLAEVCEEFGTSLPAVAVAFPVRHPAVGAVVPGPRTSAEVEQLVAAMATPQPEALWDRLAATFAGHPQV